jgi:3-oxoacyl-(acyl-carrier-protein) synthase
LWFHFLGGIFTFFINIDIINRIFANINIDKESKNTSKEMEPQLIESIIKTDDAENNLYFFESRPNCFRLVTHCGITQKDLDKTLALLEDMVK